MKMKVLQIYLSLAGLCHWVVLASGGSFVAEFLEPAPIKERLLLYFVTGLFFFMVGCYVYAKVFTGTTKNK